MWRLCERVGGAAGGSVRAKARAATAGRTCNLMFLFVVFPFSSLQAVKLGLDGEAGANNHHNLPLERFPEFQTIITKIRKMVGLTPIFGAPSQEHNMVQHNRRAGSASGR